MMVTFVSQCEKKALNKTRRVLDAFANRIGNRTWQTVITNEGLQAVKKLLRKTASKNTLLSLLYSRFL
jgi:CRISPR-associated endonuclease/helicase Cas3